LQGNTNTRVMVVAVLDKVKMAALDIHT
jgi:hypothetical protein